jgi:hypothetical protein
MAMRAIPISLAWTITRLWVLFSGFEVISYLYGVKLVTYPVSSYLFSDVQLYDSWAANLTYSYFVLLDQDPRWQYPPLAAVVFLLGYLIAEKTVGFVFLALIADALIFLMLTKRAKQESNALPALIWVMSPLVMGPIILGRFDVFPTLLAVFALLHISTPKRFGVAVAIGAHLKVWPILLLLATPRGKFTQVATWFAATFGIGSLLLGLWWNGNLFSFLSNQSSRGLQIESVGALPFQIWHAGPGSVASAIQFGAHEIVASETGMVSLVLTLIGIALIGILVFWRVTGRLDNAEPVDIVLTAVLISILTSRVISPQYMVWVFGLLAVAAFRPQNKFRRILILISISSGLGQLIYPFLYGSFIAGGWIPVMAQTVRILTLIWATVIMWLNLQRVASQMPKEV